MTLPGPHLYVFALNYRGDVVEYRLTHPYYFSQARFEAFVADAIASTIPATAEVSAGRERIIKYLETVHGFTHNPSAQTPRVELSSEFRPDTPCWYRCAQPTAWMRTLFDAAKQKGRLPADAVFPE